MTSEQVAALAATGESETLEFKATTGQRSEAAKTMCAMLNTGGGYALFGVTPEGKAIGQHVGRQTIEDVSAEIQRIDPVFHFGFSALEPFVQVCVEVSDDLDSFVQVINTLGQSVEHFR